MSHPNLTVSSPRWEPKMPFGMLVAYEDGPTRDRALHLCQHLSEQLVDDYEFQCSFWKFDHLEDSILREESSSKAAEANMIIIALRARPEILPSHRAWVESWTRHRDRRKAALVALVGTPSSPVPAPTLDGTAPFLQRIARSARMDFFDHAFGLPETIPAVLENPLASAPLETIETIVPAAPPSSHAGPHPIHKMPIPRWGINE